MGTGLERTALGIYDLRLAGRVRLFQSDNRKLQLGAGVAAWLPTGNSLAFMGDDQVSAYVFGTGEYDFGKFQIAGDLGPHFRPLNSIGGPNGALGVASELRWAAGVFVPLRQGDIRLGGSLWGSTGIQGAGNPSQNTFFSGRNTDLEWLAEARILFDKKDRLYFTGGGGVHAPRERIRRARHPPHRNDRHLGVAARLRPEPRFPQPRRKAPERRDARQGHGRGRLSRRDRPLSGGERRRRAALSGRRSCPSPKDRDKDGIPDDVDKCPDQPEDKDGIMDSDGCPEMDAENDGILDVEDACPLVPGMRSKDPKKNGCKEEHKTIVETTEGIQLLEPIQFDTGKATIKPVSFPVLDEVVEVLKSHDGVRMGVYGHTDSKGSRAMNTALSKTRAQSVMNYLITKGIARNRLESNGYGPDQPVQPATTPTMAVPNPAGSISCY